MDSRASPKRGPRPFTDRRVNSLKVRRKKLEWPKDQPFKILSLDGGGIRGLFAASLLARIERQIVPEGRFIADYFNMIAGTSTGGIIAIALGLKKPASYIEELYFTHGQEIFPPFWSRHPWLAFARQLYRPLHNHEALERLLFSAFGEASFGDSVCRLVIPAFKVPKTEIAVFKTDHHPDFKNDWRMYAWEVARSTAAAPTYFSGHEGEGYVFLDGGIWANNPIMTAIVDALSAYEIDREQIEIFSVGTGNVPFDIGVFASKGGLFRWLEIIKGAMFLTTDNAEAQANLLLGPDKILRLNPSGDAASISLNDWFAATKILPSLAANDFVDRKNDIERFFQGDPVAPRHRFYT